jgi:mannose-1-phosphate guanylyltransferase/mannose-6-phosphate isomerase
MPKLIVTILSGGSGSRLWPLSRENHPKPFIRLSDNQSLLQKAYLRGVSLPHAIEVLTVTNRELVFLTHDHYEEVKKPIHYRLILESESRNTAAAIAVAAIDIQKRYGDDALMLVLAADHIIQDQKAFQTAVDKAMKLANENQLVTFGIKPTSPDTSYGYIEADKNKALRFIEKPNLEKAQEYFTKSNFYWNSGMFCFKADVILDELQKYCPEILNATKTTYDNSELKDILGSPTLMLNESSFKSVPSNSIDYALLEKSNRVSVVPCSIGWSDIGSWNAFTDLIEPDQEGNRKQGEVFFHHTKNSSVFAKKKLVALIGMNDVIVIETSDAILVVHKSNTQDVKALFTKLKEANHETYKIHTEVHRPWGSYTVLENKAAFKVKRIFVKPNARLSLQSHKNRAEHWVVVKGIADIINNDKKIRLIENQSTYIEQGHKHQLINAGDSPLEIIEVQSGTYLGEDDIERFNDDYGRINL